MVKIGTLNAGQIVLISAASSSVGLAAIQIVRAAGAVPIATTRGPEKRPFLLENGAHHVVVTGEQDLVEEVNAITGGTGADILFDPVAGPFLEKLAAAAAPGATIFEYGSLSMAPTSYPLLEAIGKGLNIRGYTLFEVVSRPNSLAEGKSFVFDGLAAGRLRPIIDNTFPLERIVEAHRHMESGVQKGKIVVTVSQ